MKKKNYCTIIQLQEEGREHLSPDHPFAVPFTPILGLPPAVGSKMNLNPQSFRCFHIK